MPQPQRSLDLSDLGKGAPALTPEFGMSLAHAASVCLIDCGHTSAVAMTLVGVLEAEYSVSFPSVTDQIRRCWNDDQKATEHGAYGVAILIARDQTGLSVVLQSRKLTGFDYWLGDDADSLFQNKARLEVSGIRRGDNAALASRTREKLNQIRDMPESLPAYAIVVEFGTPRARSARK